MRPGDVPAILVYGVAGLTLCAAGALAVGLVDLAALVGGSVPLFVAACAAGASHD